MRVLIVSANRERSPDPVAPLGALYVVAAARRAGHDVELFDACFADEPWLPRLGAALERFAPDVVGLSMRNVDDAAAPRPVSYLEDYRAIAATVRARVPRARLVLGGAAFAIFPERFMEELGADHGVKGEGEESFVALLDHLARGEACPRLWSRRGADLDALPHPARDAVDLARYVREGGVVNVQTKRGCRFQCSYCTYPLIEGATIRARAATAVADELEAIAGLARVVFFVDELARESVGEHGTRRPRVDPAERT